MISKIISESDIVAARDLIYDAERIAIVAHKAPDGDAIGASMALYHFLYTIDKEAVVVYPDSYPAYLGWLQGVDKSLVYNQQQTEIEKLFEEVDLILCVDFNEPSRAGDMAQLLANSKTDKLLIDHHPNPAEGFWKAKISYPQIASSCEIVFRLICRMGHASEINKYCAESIFTGMMTDTGNFTFNANNAEMYYIVGELIRKGIDKDEIYRRVNTYSADRMRLMGFLLSNKMKLYTDSRTALISLSYDEQKQFNFQRGDAEGFVNLPLAIDGIVFSIFLKEEKDRIRVSLRSRGEFAVNEIAATYFNGGGHFNASGGDYFDSLENAIKKVEEIIPLYKEKIVNS
ncbi:MAG: bifunctional oligoribonuclease/PAP phosphatase NrnA [Prevotellaceae bacterium]|jgi:phosphoesterase RecJ-like protein|nr:bifunctional oligoribonuclease/PAP phosphatase NrnA [Prevotellaceae bacterium]